MNVISWSKFLLSARSVLHGIMMGFPHTKDQFLLCIQRGTRFWSSDRQTTPLDHYQSKDGPANEEGWTAAGLVNFLLLTCIMKAQIFFKTHKWRWGWDLWAMNVCSNLFIQFQKGDSIQQGRKNMRSRRWDFEHCCSNNITVKAVVCRLRNEMRLWSTSGPLYHVSTSDATTLNPWSICFRSDAIVLQSQ